MATYHGINLNKLPSDPDLRDIFEQHGWDSWGDIVVEEGSNTDPAAYRPGEYYAPEDAVFEYDERGLGDYLTIYYSENCDCWQVYISYPVYNT